MVRAICEKYPGIRPADVGEMPVDEIYILTADPESLKNSAGGRFQTISPGAAESRGIVPEFDRSRGESVVQRVRATLEEIAGHLGRKVPEVVAAMRAEGVEGDTSRLYVYTAAEAEAVASRLSAMPKPGRRRRSWFRFLRRLEG